MNNKIVSIEEIGYTDDPVYDLEVEGNHNYCVGESQTLVHNCHGAAAFHFLRTLSRFKARYIWGLSGTPSRKDGRYKLVDMVVGRVCHEAKRKDNLVPEWSLVPTGFKDSRSSGQWANLVKRLEQDPKRLKLIAEWAIYDARAGHCVLIPMSFTKPIRALVQAINKLAGETLAHEMTGSLKKSTREKLIEDAQLGNIRIIVGTARLISVGLNIPPASVIYEQMLSSNMEACEQRISRILTPHEGKSRAIVRVFLDDYKIRRTCLRNEWFGCVKHKFKPSMSKEVEQQWLRYLNGANFEPSRPGSKYIEPAKKSPVLGW